MRAIVCDRYGPPEVLRLDDVATPVPREDEVLIRVRATTVNRSDCGFRTGKPVFGRVYTGLRRPKWRVLGSEVAGEVEAVGAAVTEFAVGDEVFGLNPWALGTHAEFVRVRQSAPLAHKPAGMSFEEAAAVCDGVMLALLCLRPAKVRKGRTVLVYGASGSIGTAAVQLAKHFEAEVTAVCDTGNVETVRSLGADEVIDYTRTDFTANGRTYDVILDAVGKHTFRRCRSSIKPGGMYVTTDGLANLALTLWTARFGDRRVLFPVPPRYPKEEVVFLKGLIEAGRYRAVIDRRYPLEEVVAATRYVETGQKTGNVVLVVAEDG
ncbi:NAD(P)-dependent alcohol dehydrogenase [Nonomuraea sp. NPDC046802]|uniref:NAD(P)-dependent alcohol dehydrogenase n=1 Tax=Nonomuraea sp. NPDC046802 TaxID=3154919 RepID=UPI0033F94040